MWKPHRGNNFTNQKKNNSQIVLISYAEKGTEQISISF